MFLHMVGHLSVFVRYSEPIPPISRGGGVGVYFDWCISYSEHRGMMKTAEINHLLPHFQLLKIIEIKIIEIIEL